MELFSILLELTLLQQLGNFDRHKPKLFPQCLLLGCGESSALLLKLVQHAIWTTEVLLDRLYIIESEIS